MGQSLLNNYSFFLDGDITLSTTTVPISNDIETNTVVTLVEPADVIFIAEDGSQVERMIITAAAGVMTLGTRAIKNDNSGTTDVSLKRKRYAGQKVTLTILAHHVVGLWANNVFTGDNTFAGDHNVFTKGLPGTVFANDAARDAAITAPYDGLIVYNNIIEDYQYYRNGARVSGFGGGAGGGGVRYKDSTSDGTITGAINGVNVTYNLSNAPGSVNSLILTFNGVYMEKDQDYTIIGNVITFTYAPISGKLVAIYPTVAVGASAALTRAADDSGAINGELYRSTNDNQSLYYKDNGGDVIKLIDITTNKLNESLLPDSILSPSLVLGENISSIGGVSLMPDGKIYRLNGNKRLLSNGTITGQTATKSCLLNGGTKIATVGRAGTVLTLWIGTIDLATNAITYGTGVTLTSTEGTSSEFQIAKLATDKIIVSYIANSPANLYSRACTIAGTVPTIGAISTAVVSGTGIALLDVIYLSDDKAVLAFVDNTSAQYRPSTSILSVVGTTITNNTAVTYPSYGYQRQGTMNICKIDDTHFGVGLGHNQSYNASYDGTGVYCNSVAGNVITLGTYFTVSANTRGACFVTSDGVYLYAGANATSALYKFSIAGTVLTQVCTLGSLSISGNIVLLPGMVGVTSSTSIQRYSVDDSFTARNTINYGITPVFKELYSDNYFFVTVSGNPSYIYKIGNENRYLIGYLGSTGSMGATKTISLSGDVVTGLTGIIPGGSYYIVESGNLNLGTGLLFFGKGISATTMKVIINNLS